MTLPSRSTQVELWEGVCVAVDEQNLAANAIPVKGYRSENPLRFLEIFGNHSVNLLPDSLRHLQPDELYRIFFPSDPNISFRMGLEYQQPPYCWRNADPKNICRSFTYNTNAFYRIFTELANQKKIPANRISTLLDQACSVLSYLYRVNHYFVMKNMNNNINMYLISKTVEYLVGKEVYHAEEQELNSTLPALEFALDRARNHASSRLKEKMAIAVGRGVAFVEERIVRNQATKSAVEQTETETYRYFEKKLAIDHREKMLQLIENRSHQPNGCQLVVVVDDAAETIDDFLWLNELLELYPYLKINVLVNVAQISINYSMHMVNTTLNHTLFHRLRQRYQNQFRVIPTYCPLISFQTNFLTAQARTIIDEADLVFVKGANFFETLQLPHKDTIYAFVVFGPVSRLCTGLNDYDAVWAYVPRGKTGYELANGVHPTRNLLETIHETKSTTGWEK